MRSIKVPQRADADELAIEASAEDRDRRIEKALDIESMDALRGRDGPGKRQMLLEKGSHVLDAGIVGGNDKSHGRSQPIASRRAAAASKRVESSVGMGESSGPISSGISVQASATESQPREAKRSITA